MKRKSFNFFAFILGLFLLGIFCCIHGLYKADIMNKTSIRNKDIVRELGLTDLCVYTDAIYTRNPAVADLSMPFQDSPLSMEHFPTGSLLTPYICKLRKYDSIH